MFYDNEYYLSLDILEYVTVSFLVVFSVIDYFNQV